MNANEAIIIFSGLALLGGYLIGSIPSGLLLAKLFRLKEIPKNLDGCVSLASLWQSKHWFLALLTIILELIKIVITVFIGVHILNVDTYYEATRYHVPCSFCVVSSTPIDVFGIRNSDELIINLTFLGMFIGQIFPLFTKFKGSTGIWIFCFTLLISTLSISLAINPILLAIIIAIWCITLFFTRYSCVATLTSLIIFPFIICIYTLIWDSRHSDNLIGFCLTYSLFALLVILGHRGHIARLLKGQEPKLTLWNKD